MSLTKEERNICKRNRYRSELTGLVHCKPNCPLILVSYEEFFSGYYCGNPHKEPLCRRREENLKRKNKKNVLIGKATYAILITCKRSKRRVTEVIRYFCAEKVENGTAKGLFRG